jgi:hypothetical protein
MGPIGLIDDRNGSGHVRHLLASTPFRAPANSKRAIKPQEKNGVFAGALAVPPGCSQLVTILLCDANHCHPPAKGGNTSTVCPDLSGVEVSGTATTSPTY